MTLRALRPPALATTLLVLPALLLAQDRADVDRTQIIGNRELPKVLYIVPWKKPLPGDLAGRPLVSVVDEALAPIDRDVFRREVSYEAQVHAKAPSANQASAPAEKDSPTTPAPANQ
jgi:hypothetical protein